LIWIKGAVPGAALEVARKGGERPAGAIGPAAVPPLTGKNRWEPKLSDPKQGAPEAAGASFFLTNEAARGALSVSLLSLEVINPFPEIEPNNGIARTVSLRLRFIPKWREWQSGGRRRYHDRHPNEKQRAHSRPKMPCAKFRRTIVDRGQFTSRMVGCLRGRRRHQNSNCKLRNRRQPNLE
jgi:hypothetical protein